MTVAVAPISGDLELSRTEAENLTARIRDVISAINDQMDALCSLVGAAKAGSAWKALEYKSWTAYLIDVFPPDLELGLEQRRDLTCHLASEGVSNRAIASVTGVTEMTVRRDKVRRDVAPEQITGKDGKTYPAPAPSPKPERTQAQKDAGFVKAIHTGLSDDSIQTLGPKARQLLKEILTDALNRLEQL